MINEHLVGFDLLLVLWKQLELYDLQFYIC